METWGISFYKVFRLGTCGQLTPHGKTMSNITSANHYDENSERLTFVVRVRIIEGFANSSSNVENQCFCSGIHPHFFQGAKTPPWTFSGGPLPLVCWPGRVVWVWALDLTPTHDCSAFPSCRCRWARRRIFVLSRSHPSFCTSRCVQTKLSKWGKWHVRDEEAKIKLLILELRAKCLNLVSPTMCITHACIVDSKWYFQCPTRCS